MATTEKSEDWAINRAPTRGEYEQILADVDERLSGPNRLETKFLLVTMGELGLRSGEVVHLTRTGTHDWVDFENGEIIVPGWSPCTCGYCKQQAEQQADITDIDFDVALKERWRPSDEYAERRVPFDYKEEIEALYKRFFELYDEYPHSRVTVNRRIKKAAEISDVERSPKSITPQTLRVTAAKYHASNGMSPSSLADLMGWASGETALRYYGSQSNGLHGEMKRIYE